MKHLLTVVVFAVVSISSLGEGSDAVKAGDAATFAVPYYTGKVYPPPKSARYHDEFLPLGHVGGQQDLEAPLQVEP